MITLVLHSLTGKWRIYKSEQLNPEKQFDCVNRHGGFVTGDPINGGWLYYYPCVVYYTYA